LPVLVAVPPAVDPTPGVEELVELAEPLPSVPEPPAPLPVEVPDPLAGGAAEPGAVPPVGVPETVMPESALAVWRTGAATAGCAADDDPAASAIGCAA
jgi:hypothetical protein